MFAMRSRLIAVLTLLPAFAGAAGADEPAPLQGPAFSRPEQVVPMPAEWLAQPVQRRDWAAGADLAVTLDQHLYPALLPFIRDFAEAHHLDVAVHEGTCGISAGKLADKLADVGGFCCPPGEADRLPGLVFHTLGIAALALIVHPDNPLDDISLGQARAVFQGRLRRWDQIAGYPAGHPGGLIRTIGRLHCKARPGHWRLLLDNEDQFSPRLHEVSTISDMVATVAASSGAIGYETLWMAERYAELGEVKVLAVGGVSPMDETALVAGRYPLYRTYNVTTWEKDPARNSQAEALVAYLREHVGELDPRYGIVPVTRLENAGWHFTGAEMTGAPN